MAKQRFINTKLWSDGWIRKLNPLDRYLFLYFLTNEHTNIAGVYEVALETIAFETGIELDTLSKSMLNRLEPKVFYVDGWVCIPNFEKHQRGRGNEKIMKGIENAKSEVPSHVFEELEKRKSYSMDRVSRSTNYSDSDSDSDSDNMQPRKRGTQKKKYSIKGGELIRAFELVDSKNKTYYANTTQRAACDFLVSEYGLESVLSVIAVLHETNQIPYFPTITSPYDLKEKWVKLADAIRRKKSELKSKTPVFI